ncbi:MAG: SDR family NAD(P)-dependent oxidoreductase, partial [Oscillospiraceae bacterium]|nr:SDR family NAD(P)-dependent oxidoreductase [Oscillospiraceae bacterium]
IDVLINNAGFGISGACEFTENDEAKRLLEVNLFGAVNCSRAVLPHMRRAGRGRIVFLSSVAGEIAIPFQGWYSVSKASVLAFANALSNEVAPYGVEVTTVLPGDIASGFTAAREKSAVGDDEYGGRISASVAVMEHDERTGMTPESAGRYIARVAQKKRVRPRYVIGVKYFVFTILAKLLPTAAVKKIVGLMYAK